MHDSADYYKLKCSVFNDDKKTDLIGEGWIDLTGVVVPGGGQNDTWHQLEFKGKYAGDVRMELTYYDTRARNETVSEKPRERKAEASRNIGNGNDGTNVSGQRKIGPRDVNRRPLPQRHAAAAEERPALREPAHSAPLPVLHPQDHDQSFPHISGDQSNYQSVGSRRPMDVHRPSHQPQLSTYYPGIAGPYQEYDLPPMDIQSDTFHSSRSYYDPDGLPTQHTNSNSNGFVAHPSRASLPVTPSHPPSQAQYAGDTDGNLPSVDRYRHRSSPSSVPTLYDSSPPPLSSDSYTYGANYQHHPASLPRYNTSPVKNDVFRDSPLRQSISQRDVALDLPPHSDPSDDEGPPPPPPPVHRSSGPAMSSSPYAMSNHDHVPVPQPLNLSSNSRQMSPLDRSPLQNIERNYSPHSSNIDKTGRPPVENDQSHLAYRKQSYSTAKPQSSPGAENIPPSLRSGIAPPGDMVTNPNFSLDHAQGRQSLPPALVPVGQGKGHLSNDDTQYQALQGEDEWMISTPERPYGRSDGRGIDSDPRIVPKRRAVSPKQSLDSDQPNGSSPIPFGPDSYDVFNPSPASSSVAAPESQYATPEQAKEVARQNEVQKLREQGPIIGNDGRVIDPSDHLPTDTWAPEPERKNRKPEVVVRYKTKDGTAQEAGPRGTAGKAMRPHSFAGPVHGGGGSIPASESSVNIAAQQANARARLQKRAPFRPQPIQPSPQTHSSPAIPTVMHGHGYGHSHSNGGGSGGFGTPPAAARSSYSGHSSAYTGGLDDWSQEPTSYSISAGNSPIAYLHGRSPIQSAPTPPDKVPLNSYSPSWQESRSPGGGGGMGAGGGGMDALRAELSTIDIGGAGNGGGGGSSSSSSHIRGSGGHPIRYGN